MVHSKVFMVDTDIAVGVRRGECKDLGTNAIDDGWRSDRRRTSVAVAAVRTPSDCARHSGRGGDSGRAHGDGEGRNGSVSRVVDLGRSLREDAGSPECHDGHSLDRSCHGRRT